MVTKTEAQASTFETDAKSALATVRVSLAALTHSLGKQLHRPTDLQKSLGIDSKLSWQVFNVINESDPLAAAKLVPGEPSLKRLIRAAEGAGAAKELGAAVRRAIAELNVVVERHAEDRAEFDFMASSIASPEAAADAELNVRRAAFRAESHIWGVCTDVFGVSTIARRIGDGSETDECTIASRRGVRRLRHDAPRNVFAYRNYGAAGAPTGRTRLPLDAPSAERYGAHILPRFCSQPIPRFVERSRPDGYTAVELDSTEIGRQSDVTLTMGQVFRRCPLARGLAGEPTYHTDVVLRTPIRLIVSHLLLHRPTFGSVSPTLHCFRSTQGDEDPAIALSAPQLPSREEVQFLGAGRLAWHSPDVEGHDDMIQLAFDELGWDPSEFDTYRVVVEYPVLSSVIRMHFPVPPLDGHRVANA
jgi:hypothetical protein